MSDLLRNQKVATTDPENISLVSQARTQSFVAHQPTVKCGQLLDTFTTTGKQVSHQEDAAE